MNYSLEEGVKARVQSGPMVAYLHIDLFIGLKKRLTYR